jgi:NhaP-type Na+/H+ or K+/H+ antiporter
MPLIRQVAQTPESVFLEANIIVILISLTLFLAYISGILYAKSHIPDIFWLILFGVLLGPVFKVIDTEMMSGLAPMLVLMALNLLMFEAGLNVDLKTFRESMEKSGYLGFITFILTMFIVGYGVFYIFPELFTFSEGLLLGAMIGGTSTSTVLSILGCINLEEKEAGKCRLFLVLESIVTDSISIVTAMTLIRLIETPQVPLIEGLKDIVFVFTVATVIGFGIGIIWVQVLNIARNRPFNYIMTIAVLFFSYIFAEQAGGPGSGALAALVFGITMTNYPIFARMFNLNERVRVERRRLRGFHEEITFLIKSFLFLFVGLQMKPQINNILIGVGIAIVVGIIRVISVSTTRMFTDLTDIEAKVSRLEFSNGLTAIVLSQLPILVNGTGQFNDPTIFSDLVVPVVLTTALFGSLISPILYNRGLEVKPETDETVAVKE